MSELSPRVAQRLRDFYEHIDGTSPPSGLERFNVAAAARRSHVLRLTAAIAATFLAVLGVVVIGVANHQLGRGPAPSTPIAPALSPLPSASSRATPSPSPSASPSLSPSPTGVTAGWTPYSDPVRSYSFRYPPGWFLDGPCSTGTSSSTGPHWTEVRLEPRADHTCGSQVAHLDVIIDVLPKGYRPPLSSSGCSTALAQTPVTVDGVAGVRTVNPCAGSQFIEYAISAHGFEYVTSWSWYDDPSQRDRMVAELDEFMSTWKFSA